MNTQSDRPARRYTGIIVAVALILVVGLGLFLATRDSGSSADAAEDASATSSTTTTVAASPGADAPASTQPTDPNAVPEESTGQVDTGFVMPAPEDMPLDVTVSNTSGLSDGDTVTIHVTPHSGSNIYGVEAFLCKPDTTYLLDADIRPSQTGKCVSKPLSANSNDYLNVPIDPPYQSADLSFRVGVGSDTYDTRFSGPSTVSCGPGQPCTLVLKLQIPNGFGFKAYDVSFA